MKLLQTHIPGCFGLRFQSSIDRRGTFAKTFRATTFHDLGLESDFAESFFSKSAQGVLRGMHFQRPPADGAKLITVLSGEVLDVALDLRTGSPAFGKTTTFELNAHSATAAYIPRGVAHGFLVTRGPALLMYQVTSEYDSQLDAGVLWNSIGLDWPVRLPILSERDQAFPSLAELVSPFSFSGHDQAGRAAGGKDDLDSIATQGIRWHTNVQPERLPA